jgi:phosphinothricin acetyltransferase
MPSTPAPASISAAAAAPSVVVRRAVPADAEAVAAVHNQGIAARTATFETEPRTADDRRRAIEAAAAPGGRFPILVAEAGGRVLGWGSLAEHSPRACYRGIAECSVYVDAAARGRGVGAALLGALVDEARGRGFWKLVSRAFPFNAASRAMCRRAGFREVGVYARHARLDGAWLDVVIVERLIPENQR